MTIRATAPLSLDRRALAADVSDVTHPKQGGGRALPSLWRDAALPPAWPDRARNAFRLAWWLVTMPFGRYRPADLPPGLELSSPVPAYAREAFHGMPNGYYSRDVVEGYDRGFELVMLRRVEVARRNMAERMAGAGRTLDVGCGSGRLAQAMRDAGAREVWGIDPSPYMLQRATRRVPEARFTQGVIERAAFPDEYFDAAGACFLFHELPGSIAARALDELARILRPGGILCITDPCREHLEPESRLDLLRQHGWQALYFHMLARLVYEPFLADWHSITDPGAWLDSHGFELLERTVDVPFAALVARKR